MIAYVEGKLVETWGNMCLILTSGGVGYAVALPAHTLASLPRIGEQVAFYTSLVVREDSLELFGFSSFDERQTFETLVTISKVGARTAQSILSVFSPEELQQLVAEEDFLPLTQVPGIGKKTAQHVFLELKDKMKDLSFEKKSLSSPHRSSVLSAAVEGLVGLGYTETMSISVVREILHDNPSLDEADVLKHALQKLSS